jgi:hypothetical protein
VGELCGACSMVVAFRRVYKVLVRTFEGKSFLGGAKHRWKLILML